MCLVLLLAACPSDDADDETTAAEESGSASTTASTSDGSATETSASTSASTSAEDSGGDTGSPETTCSADSDCVLVNDCCTCAAFHVDDNPGMCDLACEQSSCSALNLGEVSAACVFGHCEIADVSCDPATVACDALPPECQDGWLPSVVGGCWGGCIPAQHCDVVPDCGSCPDDETCIEHSIGFGGLVYTCRPIAPECDGTPSCACMPGVCDRGADTCVDGKGTISCACPEC